MDEKKAEHPAVRWYNEWVGKRKESFETLLPAHISFEKFTEVIKAALIKNPALIKVQDQVSLYSSCLECAQDGLLPNGKDAVLVIFNTTVNDKKVSKAQYIPMIGGVLKKIRNSGELSSISAHVVHTGDDFDYQLGDEEKIYHKPALVEKPGKVICVYSILKTKDGAIYRELMSFAEIERIRNGSPGKNGMGWKDHWDEMAKKTVIKRLAKRAPLSEEVDRVLSRGDEDYPRLEVDIPTPKKLTKFNPEESNITLINEKDLSKKDKEELEAVPVQEEEFGEQAQIDFFDE